MPPKWFDKNSKKDLNEKFAYEKFKPIQLISDPMTIFTKTFKL